MNDRPYPEGIAWDEAWRQRKRSEALVDAASNLLSAIDEADSLQGVGDRSCNEDDAIACLRELIAR